MNFDPDDLGLVREVRWGRALAVIIVATVGSIVASLLAQPAPEPLPPLHLSAPPASAAPRAP